MYLLLLWKEVVSQTIEQVLQKVRVFSNIFRLIDDLCTFNNDEFGNNYIDVYLDEVMKENDPYKSLFLDFSIKARGRKYTTELINKTYLPFYIDCVSYFDSSIPSKIFFTSIGP